MFTFTTIRKLLQDEAGVTAIEYGLIAALVAVALVGTLSTLSGSLKNTFSYISNQLASASGG